MIFYFTGTGNSRYCARLLADKLGDHCTDTFHFIRDSVAAELSSTKPWVFVCPTYGWQLPGMFADFIRAATLFRQQGRLLCHDLRRRGRQRRRPTNRALCEREGTLHYHGTLQLW